MTCGAHGGARSSFAWPAWFCLHRRLRQQHLLYASAGAPEEQALPRRLNLLPSSGVEPFADAMTSHPAPQRTAFSSAAEWLDAWVRHRIEDRPSALVRLPGVDDAAAYLHGSIGYDSAITVRGEVWVNEYDLDGPRAFQENWRPAEAKDVIGHLVIAARNHPELAALLPARTPSAHGCPSCKGTGERHLRTTDGDALVPVPGMICGECAGLGWLAA
jgi:hypothetical protein